ncbi:MAG: poly-A polymerase [Leptospirales bacterium]|nr:poly-A polymerase [Leptospirales bacterium]
MNQADLLRSLPENIQSDIATVHGQLNAKGFECFLVGGCVRDLLLNKPIKDLDFTTNAEPTEVQKIFKRTVPTGIKHGTMTVLIEDRAYEVTTYRAEGNYSDARRPDRITFAKTLSEDLSRRDFTINALALDPHTGKITDEHHGLIDLQNKILRTIGKPEERFFEDGLRTVRACRFASVLGFTIEPATLAALSHPEIQKRTALVAIERFTDELWKGFRGDTVSTMILHLERTGLVDLFVNFPGRTSPDTLSAVDRMSYAENRMGYWLSQFYPRQTAEIAIEPICRKLKFSGAQTQHCQVLARIIAFSETADSYSIPLVRRFCARLKRELNAPLNFLREISEIGEVGEIVPLTKLLLQQFQLILGSDPLLPTDLHLDGNDLKSLGFQGKMIGEKIEELLSRVYEDPSLNSREKLLELIRAK